MRHCTTEQVGAASSSHQLSNEGGDNAMLLGSGQDNYNHHPPGASSHLHTSPANAANVVYNVLDLKSIFVLAIIAFMLD